MPCSHDSHSSVTRAAEARRQLLALLADRAAAALGAVARRIVGQAMDPIDVEGVAEAGGAAPGQRRRCGRSRSRESRGTCRPARGSRDRAGAGDARRSAAARTARADRWRAAAAPLALSDARHRPVVAAGGDGAERRLRRLVAFADAVAGRRRVPGRLRIEPARQVVAAGAAHGVEGALVLEAGERDDEGAGAAVEQAVGRLPGARRADQQVLGRVAAAHRVQRRVDALGERLEQAGRARRQAGRRRRGSAPRSRAGGRSRRDR